MPYQGDVYNIEVEEDNSYTTAFFAVHNCLDAMAHGRPVIASEGAGASDLVDDSFGFVVPIRSPEAIADRIDWFKKNRDRIPEMGQKARWKAKKFTWAKIRKRYAQLFTTIQARG